ncbi:MAG: terminase gpA endonuclease subunit [Pseudomonadota bacterium]
MRSAATLAEEIRQPLADYIDPARIRKKAAVAIRPPELMTVAEAAEKYRFLKNTGGGYVGPWKNSEVPYMVEPMEALTSRLYRTVCFIGPSQSAKTSSLFENWLLYSAICDPADMLLVQTTKDLADDYSNRRISKLIENSPEMIDVHVPGESTMHNLVFRTGMQFTLGWPASSQLRGRDIPRVGATDYDNSDGVGKEGSLYDLLLPRMLTFGSAAMCCIETSPAKPVMNPDWKPKTPHEAPPVRGGLGIYNNGTRGRYQWPCPQCGDYFEGDFDLLVYDEKADPLTAGEEAYMKAPCCGYPIRPLERRDMMAEANWVHEGQWVEAGRVVGERRRTDVVSYWLKGVAARDATWSDLVQKVMRAESEFALTGDEQPLQTVYNTGLSWPFQSRLKTGKRVNADQLRELADDIPLRIVPEAARCLIAAVDVQGNRFVVQIFAFGERMECWLIDRFELFTPPEGAPGRGDGDQSDRMIDPGGYLEDWDIVETSVMDLTYPASGDEGLSWRVAQTMIDSGGAEGVTANAYSWWRSLKKRGRQSRVALVKGASRKDAPRIAESFPDSQRKDRHAGARGEIPVWLLNTNRLMDQVWNAITRETAGPAKMHLPRDLADVVFEEFCAEERGPSGWRATSSGARNEAFDLSVYALAGALKLKLDRVSWDKPPAYARPAATNSLTLRTEEAGNQKRPVKPRADRLAAMARRLA